MKRLLLILLVLMLSCGAVQAGQTAASVPGTVLDDDEKRLWLRADEAAKKLDSSSVIYRNAEMEGYFDSVVRKLIPAEQLRDVPVRVSVIRDPAYNAFAIPTGRIYVHSGMLASMESEAQFATLIGHESVHALNRHAIKEMRDAKGKLTFSAILGALTGNVLLPFGQLGALASISGYSRDMESEADREGFRMLVRAGYEPTEAPKIFVILQKEALEEKIEEPYFFASHPKLQERIDNYQNLLKTDVPGTTTGVTNRESFIRSISPLLLISAEMDIKAGRFERGRSGLDRYLAVMGANAKAYFLYGESFRQGGDPENLAKATEYYHKAVAADPSCPDPHRILGLLAYKRNDREQARISLDRYLKLFPKAPDRGHIEEMLKSLR